MVQCGPQGLLVVPSLVEGLEDVDELSLVEAVEASYHRVEFPDVFLALVRLEGTALDAETFGPVGEAVVRRGEPPGERDDAIPQRILGAGAGDRQGIQHVEVHVRLHKTPRIPVE